MIMIVPPVLTTELSDITGSVQVHSEVYTSLSRFYEWIE